MSVILLPWNLLLLHLLCNTPVDGSSQGMLPERPVLPNRESKIITCGKASLIWTQRLPSRAAQQPNSGITPGRQPVWMGGAFSLPVPSPHHYTPRSPDLFCRTSTSAHVLGMMKNVQFLLSNFRCSWEEQLSDGSELDTCQPLLLWMMMAFHVMKAVLVQSYGLLIITGCCLNCQPLQKEASLTKTESRTNMWVYTYLKGRLTLRKTAVLLPLLVPWPS